MANTINVHELNSLDKRHCNLNGRKRNISVHILTRDTPKTTVDGLIEKMEEHTGKDQNKLL